MRSALSTVAVAGLLLGSFALPANARSGGHPGATGRPGGGTCNRCHSPQTYDGLRIQLGDEHAVDCFEQTDGALPAWQQTFYVVPYGAAVDVSLLLDEPPEGSPDGSTVGLFCPEGDSCQGPVAGFGVEVQGALWREGQPFPLEPAAGESGMKQALETESPPGSPTEVIHSQPRGFTGGEAKWGLTLRAPAYNASAANPQSVTLYASANACNGNGQADVGDITAVASQVVYFETPGGGSTAPSCFTFDCASVGAVLDREQGGCVCPAGTTLDESGVCQGCGCRTTGSPATALGWAGALALFGLVLRRRRR